MKTVGLFILIGVCFSRDPGNKRLDEFLEKLDRFYERMEPSGRWSMPNLGTDTHDTQMPMTELQMKFRDEDTGLEYSPEKEKIYSPDLEIGLDLKTRLVYDLKEGKKYKLDELKRKRKQAKS